MRRLLLLAALLAVLPSHATPAHAQAGVGLMFAARSAWSPLSLSWAAAYDSDEGITTLAGAVLQWDDISGNGHTLTPAATGPAYTGSGGPGGHAYLTFASRHRQRAAKHELHIQPSARRVVRHRAVHERVSAGR